MKKWIYASLIPVCIAALLICVAAMVLPVYYKESAPQKSTAAPHYVLRSEGGHPALFDADEHESQALSEYVDIYTNLLPAADKAALERGIAVHTKAELAQLLEDLGR